jgi:3-dehydroquinate synthase
VDSSVGGKVAINYSEHKNILGNFYQPKEVLISTKYLQTLDPREYQAGMSEVIKYSFIYDKAIAELLSEDDLDISEIVYRCCSAKAAFVEEDELDNGRRMMLNFGHTFAHAIEALHNFKDFNHGEAVAMGMRLALTTGIYLGITDPGLEGVLDTLLASHAYVLPYPNPTDLIDFMRSDKKNSEDNFISLILIETMGNPILYKIRPDNLEKIIGSA